VAGPRGDAKNAERRTSVRVDVEVEVGFESDHNFYTGLTQDISSGGLFVATHHLRPVGTHVLVSFTLPGRKEAIRADSEVRWLRDARAMRTDQPQGMGLRFLDLAPADKAAIVAFLKTRDSLYYDDE
jgi:uncharacterized protein (TIGR02266 family)